jgi:epoxyqueuosine reductase
MSLTKEMIKAEALRLGFSFIGFSMPVQTLHFSQYNAWVHSENHPGMDFLSKQYVFEARQNPSILLENVRTVITLGIAYQPQNLPNINPQSKKEQGIIASYACLPDYHDVLKEKSQALISFINKNGSAKIRSRFFVDSGPVMEKDFAFTSGLGWIGKNSLFISPYFGSYCLLGCLFIDFELLPDRALNKDLCIDCEICIQSCPTKAICHNKTINANRCISFLTTRYKGEIDDSLSKRIGNKVFGCDICQTVCPLNSINRNIDNTQQNNNVSIIDNKIDLISELFLDEKQFFAKYSRTTISKYPHELFLRNIIIAMGNSRNEDFLTPLIRTWENQTSQIIRNAAIKAIELLKSGISTEE